MKKTKTTILMICITLLSIGVYAKPTDGKAITGNSLTKFGNYTIVDSNSKMVLGNVVVKAYDLNYEDINSTIRIGVLKQKDCTSFVVRSDEFEIMYVCNKDVFGVKKTGKEFRTLPINAYDQKLNKESYYSQRLITNKRKTEEELLGLIACYFPNLVTEDYQALF